MRFIELKQVSGGRDPMGVRIYKSRFNTVRSDIEASLSSISMLLRRRVILSVIGSAWKLNTKNIPQTINIPS